MSFYSGNQKISGNNSVHTPDVGDLQNRLVSFDDTGNIDGITNITELTDQLKTKSIISLLFEITKKGLIYLDKRITSTCLLRTSAPSIYFEPETSTLYMKYGTEAEFYMENGVLYYKQGGG